MSRKNLGCKVIAKTLPLAGIGIVLGFMFQNCGGVNFTSAATSAPSTQSIAPLQSASLPSVAPTATPRVTSTPNPTATPAMVPTATPSAMPTATPVVNNCVATRGQQCQVPATTSNGGCGAGASCVSFTGSYYGSLDCNRSDAGSWS